MTTFRRPNCRLLASVLVLATPLFAAAARRSPQSIQAANTSKANAVAVTLPVAVLPTSFGLPDVPAPTYPANLSVDVPPQVQVAAYGAAGHVWLAPPSWTGDAAVGADGSVLVRLFPVGRDGTSGPRVIYSAEVGCAGCKVADAAPYFPEAMKAWNSDDNFDGKNPIPIPKGLVVHRVSKTFVTYALPNENNLHIRGAAFYDSNGDGFYEEVRLVLPATDERLAEFLLKYFGDHISLR